MGKKTTIGKKPIKTHKETNLVLHIPSSRRIILKK
jgi:hypothetical protein